MLFLLNPSGDTLCEEIAVFIEIFMGMQVHLSHLQISSFDFRAYTLILHVYSCHHSIQIILLCLILLPYSKSFSSPSQVPSTPITHTHTLSLKKKRYFPLCTYKMHKANTRTATTLKHAHANNDHLAFLSAM